MAWFHWFGKQVAIRRGAKVMDQITVYLQALIQNQMLEDQKIYTLLYQLRNTRSLEQKLQIYIALKAEIGRDRTIEKKIKALENNLKSVLGHHLKEMHDQI